MSKRSKSDEFATRFAIQKVRDQGWTVIDLNKLQKNYPNSDLRLINGSRICHVQVKGKLQKRLNWIGVGYASDSKIQAGKLFNTAAGGTPCDIVMSVVMSEHAANANVRFFVFPVEDANAIFLKHARYHVAQLTKSGKKRSGSILLGTFVGPGTHRVSNILDLQECVKPYENAFHHLDA